MKAIVEFLLDLRRLPLGIQIWLLILGMSNMLIPMFFFRHLEAKITLLATFLSFAIGVFLHRKKGMKRLLGFMHAPWVAALYFLINGIFTKGINNHYGLWMLIASILTTLSLIIDMRDIAKYMSGKRESLI